jgi:tol-pal system protein YbgF
MHRKGLAFLLLALLPLPAAAGLFDDTEARRQIAELREQTTRAIELQAQAKARLETLESALRMQLELANQIEALRGELARLRGQVEVLQHESGTNQRRQRDYYVDLDTRLRSLENAAANLARAAAAPTPSAAEAAKPDPAAITREYEAALSLFRDAKYKEAQSAFATFVDRHPDDPLAPSAQYWLGNAHYALRDCKKAIAAQEAVADKWPESTKAPDALLAIGTCQRELGDAKSARKTLETLVAKYPSSAAAGKAKDRLKKK